LPFASALPSQSEGRTKSLSFGYRIHLVYRCNESRSHNDLLIELQIRTRLRTPGPPQRRWGRFLTMHQTVRTKTMAEFFSLAGSAFAHLKTAPSQTTSTSLQRDIQAVEREARSTFGARPQSRWTPSPATSSRAPIIWLCRIWRRSLAIRSFPLARQLRQTPYTRTESRIAR
jgi:hypothetical protein